jgi:hypothetical protein
MYSGALVMLFGTPLALGTWRGLLMFIPMAFTIAWRARDEERFLGLLSESSTSPCAVHLVNPIHQDFTEVLCPEHEPLRKIFASASGVARALSPDAVK